MAFWQQCRIHHLKKKTYSKIVRRCKELGQDHNLKNTRSQFNKHIMIQETQDHNSSNTTSQVQEMKPFIKCEWNGHDINSITNTKKTKTYSKIVRRC